MVSDRAEKDVSSCNKKYGHNDNNKDLHPSVSIQAWEIIENESERIPTIKAVFEVVLALFEEVSPVVR